MRKLKFHIAQHVYLITFIITLISISYSQAQIPVATDRENVALTLPEIALLDLEPNNSTVSLELPAPTEAGLLNGTVSANNAKWLNYTSAVSLGQRRKVTVEVSSGTIPKGTQLKITSSNSASGAGDRGSTVGSVVLSYSPQLLINNIGGAYTGNGLSRGHALSYSLEVVDVSQLDFDDSNTLSISFTLLDI